LFDGWWQTQSKLPARLVQRDGWGWGWQESGTGKEEKWPPSQQAPGRSSNQQDSQHRDRPRCPFILGPQRADNNKIKPKLTGSHFVLLFLPSAYLSLPVNRSTAVHYNHIRSFVVLKLNIQSLVELQHTRY
jgi:hypothetical protein